MFYVFRFFEGKNFFTPQNGGRRGDLAPPPAPFLYGPAISVINAFSGLFFRKQGFSSERKVLILLLLVLFHLQNRLV